MAKQVTIQDKGGYTYTVPEEQTPSEALVAISSFTKIKHPNLFIDMESTYSYAQFVALFRIVVSLQPIITENFLHKGDISIRANNVFWDHENRMIEVTLPMRGFGVRAGHYEELEKALMSMSNISVTFPQKSMLTQSELTTTGGLCRVAINRENKRNYLVHFFFHEEIIKTIVNPHNGFTQILQETVERIRSVYTAKLYFLICQRGNLGSRCMSYNELREKLNISPDKYSTYKDFRKRILKDSSDELKNSTNYWFAFYERFPPKSKTPDIIYFRIYNGVTNTQEQRDHQSRIDRIKAIGNHLGVNHRVMNHLVNKITIGNSKYIYDKSNEVIAYIADHSDSIVDQAAYYRQTMQNIIYKELFNIKELQIELDFSNPSKQK